MKSLLLLSFAAVLSSAISHDDPNLLKPLKRPALGKLARCTGSSSCRACKNCNYCAHCAGGGGTCGVCGGGGEPVRTYRAPSRSSSSTRRSSGGGGSSYTPARPKVVLTESVSYYVSATTLNMRAEPSADAELLRVLDQNDIVTVLEIVNDKWVKVSAESASLGDLEGYVSRAYLASEKTY